MPGRLKSKVITVALAVLWLAGNCLAFQSASVSPEARQRYAQARKLLAVGEKDKAIEELKAIIQLAPEFIEAHRDFLDNQRDKAESFIEQYEAYVKQNPNSAAYHYLLGKAYSNANKRDKSDAEFKKALELDPKSGWAMLAVSSIATRENDNARSIELLKQSSKHAGDSVPLRQALGSSFLYKKLYEHAQKEADLVIKTDPQEFSAYTTRWQAQLSLTIGADNTRAEVLGEIQDIESKHAKDIRALLAVQSGYQMLEDEKAAERAKKAILAIDPKYFERQPYSFYIGTSSGKTIQLTGANARLFAETFPLKDERQKLEIYNKLDASLDEEAKLHALYPYMLKSYVALKDVANAERLVDLMIKKNLDAAALAEHRVTLARAYIESKLKLDAALDNTRLAVEEYRKPLPTKDGVEPSEYAKENAKNKLAGALHLQGKILLEKGMADQAAAVLNESVSVTAQEESLLDLGRAYAKLGKNDEAVDALSKAYAYEGNLQPEARASLDKVYGARAKTRPLDGLLKEAVDRRRAEVREAAIAKAVRDITKTEPKQAPSFSLTTLSGQKVELQDLRGKVLLLNFWATW